MRKILVSAYACEPFKGSEQGVGWNWVLQMSKNNEVHVITRSNNQEIIEANMPSDISKHLKFHYYDTHQVIKGLKNKAKGLYFYYFFWQIGIIPFIKRLKRKHKFDYSMHLTMGSIWMPTFLPLFNIPFIWGPLGGGDGEPNSFRKTLNFKAQVLQIVRRVLNASIYINPFILLRLHKSNAILLRTTNTLNIIPKRFRHKSQVILETAMEESVFLNKKEENSTNNIRIISTGRLMASKNLITLVKSLSMIDVKNKNIKVTIIGSGPENKSLQAEFDQMDTTIAFEIINELPRAEVLNRLTEADIFAFPSLREGGSWALMEAMAIGLPVVCLKWAGMEIITNDKCTIQLPVTNPNQMVTDMAAALSTLIENPSLRKSMGEAGRRRIKEVFNWDSKGAFMEKLLTNLDKRDVR